MNKNFRYLNDIPYWAHKEKEDLSPEKRKEVEAEAERMYKEYKEQCEWGRKPKTLGEFNPYELNFDFIESIPEDEWKELIKLYNKGGMEDVAIYYIDYCWWLFHFFSILIS